MREIKLIPANILHIPLVAISFVVLLATVSVPVVAQPLNEGEVGASGLRPRPVASRSFLTISSKLSPEVAIQVKLDANTLVQPRRNHVDVLVGRKFVQDRPTTTGLQHAPDLKPEMQAIQDRSDESRRRNSQHGRQGAGKGSADVPTIPVADSSIAPAREGNPSPQSEIASTAIALNSDPGLGLATDDGVATNHESPVGILALIPTPTLLFALLALTLGALVFVRYKRTSYDGLEDVEDTPSAEMNEGPPATVERRKRKHRIHPARRDGDRSASGSDAEVVVTAVGGDSPALIGRVALPPIPELFGAYRVEQEVGKLVIGLAHRMDVLASRAADDRRAIEASLLKAISSSGTTDEGRKRARVALEEYGFVARQSANLLLANDAYERSSAARALGEIGSASALPFLLEALYDKEEIVRFEAVNSLGALRLPSAIGALLDMARHHPEMPAELVSRALSACSVDCPNVGAGMSESELHRISGEAAFTGEITSLEPLAAVADLEASSDDPCFAELLLQLKSESIEARVDAARSLGDYRVSSAVTALVEIASCDAESGVRAAAIASLAAIDHHSVFVSIVVALVDESREVRAAAARSLSILSLNRADAYARIAAHADQKTVRDVALACIKSGIAKQAVDRLCGGDRWQSYEAFATLAVLASANEFALIFETVEQHPDQNVAIAAARVLGVAGRSEALPGLRQLAVRDSISETLRTVVLEVIYKIDQSQPV